ncbi:hypothetical protein ACHAQD_008939 [Fusarium lateritium]
MPFFDLYCFGSEFPDIQNLAVDWPGEDDSDLDELLEDVSSFFPDCKRLIVVMAHQPLPNGDVKDEDEMNITFLGDWFQWDEMKREISERFPLYPKQELPSIEGVEVAPVRS